MNKTNIKSANCHAIKNFATDSSVIQGTKLNALYLLIQKKGEVMNTEDKKLNGVKCLEFNPGEYVAMIHTPCKKGFFFPCMLKTYHLQDTN
jgi:hypothetical protein